MNITEFSKRISRPAERARVAQGFVKPSETEDTYMLFSPGFGCERWVKIPVDWIEDAEHLGEQTCGDHAHHAARLSFKRELSGDASVAVDLMINERSFKPPIEKMPDPMMGGGLPGQLGHWGNIPMFDQPSFERPLPFPFEWDWGQRFPRIPSSFEYGLLRACIAIRTACYASGKPAWLCSGLCK